MINGNGSPTPPYLDYRIGFPQEGGRRKRGAYGEYENVRHWKMENGRQKKMENDLQLMKENVRHNFR